MSSWVFRFYVGTRPGKGRGLPDDHLLSQCDKLVEDSVATLSSILGVEGVTVFGAQGYWKGEREETFVFEVVRAVSLSSAERSVQKAEEAARALAAAWFQDTVLLTTVAASSSEIGHSNRGCHA